MKKSLVFTLICILSGLILIACQRDKGVEAGNEQAKTGTYQPRPSAQGEAENNKNWTGGSQEMKGELVRVDMAKKTMTVRTENGLEQTFKWDDSTAVEGVEQPAAGNTKTGKQTTHAANNQIRALMGKEGSEVTVNWKDDNGAKMATAINVTQVSSSKAGTSKSKARKNTY